MKKLIMITVLLATPALAAEKFTPPKGVFGDKQGCTDHYNRTESHEGIYVGYDEDGKSWGGYGEMSCDIKSVTKERALWAIKSGCLRIGMEEAGMPPYDVEDTLEILSPTKIVLNGDVLTKCKEPPEEPVEGPTDLHALYGPKWNCSKLNPKVGDSFRRTCEECEAMGKHFSQDVPFSANPTAEEFFMAKGSCVEDEEAPNEEAPDTWDKWLNQIEKEIDEKIGD